MSVLHRFSRVAAHDRTARRGQSLVEFALVLPMLLVLLLGIVDFGRVFQAGIVTEASARNAAEAAAQEYLQIKRGAALPSDLDGDDYARIHGVAVETACQEAERLPNRAGTGTSCTMPAVAVCIHDAELVGYGTTWCGRESVSAPAECTSMQGWNPAQANGLPYVEVRVCYQFTTLFNLQNLQLPLANGLNIGDIWLQKDRVFTVAGY